MEESFFKRLRYRLEYRILMLGVRWIPKLPRHVMLALARAAAFIAWHLDRRGHNTALANLEAIFPDWTSRKRRAIALESYRTMSQTFLDLFWMGGQPQGELANHIRIDPETKAKSEEYGKEGGVWICPHYGNFEFLPGYFACRGFSYHIIAQTFKNPLLTGVFEKLRRHGLHEIIPQEGAVIRLLKAVKKGGRAGFLPDLNLRPNPGTVPQRSFGRIMPITPLHAILAQRTGSPILMWLCRPLVDGTYQIELLGRTFVGREESLEHAVQRVWDVFEVKLRERPEHYLWMYKHWRYNPENPEVNYPAYANRSEFFDNWLKKHREE